MKKVRTVSIGLALAMLVPLFWGIALDVSAAPPSLPLAGITPTPTSTPPPTAPGPTPTPGIGVADPAITKRGEPSLALPGEPVTFVIAVTNTGQSAAVDVAVTDTMPDYLDIVNVTSSQGTVTVEGQRVTVEVGTIGSGFVVEIVIETRVAVDAPAPLDLSNVATLSSANGGERTSLPATIVVPVSRMPETGGQAKGTWVVPLIGLIAILIGLLTAKRPAHE